MLTPRLSPWLLAAMLLLDARSATAQPYEHLSCYRVKDTKAFASADAVLTALQSQFGTVGCEIKPKAREFCVPVDLTVGVVDDGSHTAFAAEDLAFDRLCYRVKCTATPPSTLEVSDGFGTRTLEKLKISTICTPAVKGPPPTTTTTTLPPLPPCVGGGGFPACTGDCSHLGATFICDARNGDSSCACVLPCNELDPSGGDQCGVGGCPVDSSCQLLTPTNCGCVFSPGS
jgi:hypothetical protein